MRTDIRAMQEADLDSVLAIAASLPEAPHWPRAAYLAAIAPESAPKRIALVAEMQAGIAGFAVASVVENRAELESIAVASNAQGRGVGTAVVAALISALRMAGVADLDLEVRASNLAARRLYARAGFGTVGRRPGYYREPLEDAVLLRLCLQP